MVGDQEDGPPYHKAAATINKSVRQPNYIIIRTPKQVLNRRIRTMADEVLTTISPTTNEGILTRTGVTSVELEVLTKVATEAFSSWRTTKLADRQIIVKKALKLLADKTDELALELTVQMGRPIAYTGKEVTTAVKRAEYLLKVSDDVLKDTDGEAEKGFKRFIRKTPVGPVLIIFAWNVCLHPMPWKTDMRIAWPSR